MAAPRQCFFDTFNGQGPRSAWGPLETILCHFTVRGKIGFEFFLGPPKMINFLSVFGSFFCEFPDFGGVSKMAAPRQCFFDTFNGQGPRSAWGPPETIHRVWRLQAGVKKSLNF